MPDGKELVGVMPLVKAVSVLLSFHLRPRPYLEVGCSPRHNRFGLYITYAPGTPETRL